MIQILPNGLKIIVSFAAIRVLVQYRIEHIRTALRCNILERGFSIMRPSKPRVTWILFIILSIFYLMVMYTQGLIRNNPLDFFASVLGPAIGLYVFAEIIARQWYKHTNTEKDLKK